MTVDEVRTLYVRGVPEDVVREAKALAARRGMTLTALVIESLRQAVDPSGPLASSDALTLDQAWYDTHAEELARQHPDEYLAIVDGEVVDSDTAFSPLAQRVQERFGPRPVLMPKCAPGGRDVELRSPRHVRM